MEDKRFKIIQEFGTKNGWSFKMDYCININDNYDR
jgi:hypothetical protein